MLHESSSLVTKGSQEWVAWAPWLTDKLLLFLMSLPSGNSSDCSDLVIEVSRPQPAFKMSLRRDKGRSLEQLLGFHGNSLWLNLLVALHVVDIGDQLLEVLNDVGITFIVSNLLTFRFKLSLFLNSVKGVVEIIAVDLEVLSGDFFQNLRFIGFVCFVQGLNISRILNLEEAIVDWKLWLGLGLGLSLVKGLGLWIVSGAFHHLEVDGLGELADTSISKHHLLAQLILHVGCGVRWLVRVCALRRHSSWPSPFGIFNCNLSRSNDLWNKVFRWIHSRLVISGKRLHLGHGLELRELAARSEWPT